MTRCVRRTVSERFSSSSWNGGVSDAFSTVSSCASTSISPDVRDGFTVPSGRAAHAARDGDAEFVAQRLGRGEGLGAVGVAHDLHEAFAVAQVDEDHAAMVAPAVDPAHHGDGLVEVAAVDAAAVVGSCHSVFSKVATGATHSVAPPLGILFLGATTPIEITYFNASSTVMSSSRTFDFGTITK